MFKDALLVLAGSAGPLALIVVQHVLHSRSEKLTLKLAKLEEVDAMILEVSAKIGLVMRGLENDKAPLNLEEFMIKSLRINTFLEGYTDINSDTVRKFIAAKDAVFDAIARFKTEHLDDPVKIEELKDSALHYANVSNPYDIQLRVS